MLVALDEKINRVFATKAVKGQKYFCQGCNEELCLKQGEIRRHHFSHKCGDACEYYTNKTEWHYEWQECFGLENSEVIFECGKIKHIADIQIGNTVIEFQHSRIDKTDVVERNEFYNNWGLKMVWVFDARSEVENERLHSYEINSKYNWRFKWDRVNKSVLWALEGSNTEGVFLQVSDNCLIRITWWPNGYTSNNSYWSKLRKFAGDIMDKKHAIKYIRSIIDKEYIPKPYDTTGDLLQETIDMARAGLIF